MMVNRDYTQVVVELGPGTKQGLGMGRWEVHTVRLVQILLSCDNGWIKATIALYFCKKC